MSNRLEQLRELRGMTQAQLAELAHTTASQIGKLERGERRLTVDWQQRLARALDCAAGDLMAEGDMLSVPIKFAIAAADSDTAIEQPSEPFERLAALPRLHAPHQCVAARVEDHSADRLYPPGSVLIVRQIAYLPKLTVGQKIVVSRDGEALVGILDRSALGELVLLLRSTAKNVPASIVLQRPPQDRDGHGIADRFAPASFASGSLERDTEIVYTPDPRDRANIVGVVVMAITPE